MTGSVARALAAARERGIDRLDAQLLLAHAMQRSRTWLLAHDDEPLSPAQWHGFAAMLRRRVDGEPIAYILGEKEFHGLLLSVSPKVLVPRPDTETLVDWALALLGNQLVQLASPRVVDLGTGSGAIALAVKKGCPRADVTALDASADALAVAQANGERLGLEVAWRQGDWWDAVAPQRFDLALGNPPYIAQGDPHLAALGHEPEMALTSGPDGLDAIRQIVAQAPMRLEPGGWLLLEHGHDQARAVAALMTRAGFASVQSKVDLAGTCRCTGGRCAISVTTSRE